MVSIKKVISIAYLSVLLGAGLTSAVFAASDLFERNLYFGLRGDPDVVRLQEFLTTEGFYSGPQNGNFYAFTKEGVKTYQKVNHIEPASGYFGPITRGLINNKLRIINAERPATNKSIQIQALQSQIDELLKQLAALQAAATVATTTTAAIPLTSESTTTALSVSEVVATSIPEIATTTTALTNPFDSTLQIKSTWADYTMTRFSAVVLGEFVFSADEKIAITKLRFTNTGTLSDDSIIGLRLLNSKTGSIVSMAILENGAAIFSMTPDTTKTDKGLVVSGEVYYLLADNILASTYGIRKTVEYDIKSEADISAFDYDNLSRVAKLKQITFPVIGSYIKTY